MPSFRKLQEDRHTLLPLSCQFSHVTFSIPRTYNCNKNLIPPSQTILHLIIPNHKQQHSTPTLEPGSTTQEFTSHAARATPRTPPNASPGQAASSWPGQQPEHAPHPQLRPSGETHRECSSQRDKTSASQGTTRTPTPAAGPATPRYNSLSHPTPCS